MAEKNMRLRVVLDLVDKALAPLKRISQSSKNTADTLKAARDQLKQLNATQAAVGKFRETQAGLQQTEAKLKAARVGLEQLKGGLNQTGVPTKAFAASLAKAHAEAERLGATFNSQQQQLRQLDTRLTAAGISTRNLAGGEQQLSARIASTTANINTQTAALKRQSDEQRKLAKLQSQAQKAAGVGAGMAASGAVSMYGGQRALRGTAGLLNAGVDFDAQMSKVQALTRLEKTSADYAMLRAQALDLGATTMFSATQAAQGQSFLAMAGFDAKAIKGAMPGLLDMAKAGDMDLGRTADISSNILSAYGIDPNKMGSVADTLTKVFTTSNVNLEMLGNTMSYVGPVARAAGVDLETTAAMAGLLGNVGIQGEKGGTAMRAMLLRLSAPTGGAAKMLNKLGVKTRDAKGNVLNVMEVLAKLAKQTEKMGSAQKLEVLKTVFGEEPAAAMTELLDKAGSGGILEYLNKVRDSAGAASKTASIMADNVTGDLDEMSSTWEDVRISLFDANQGEIRSWIQNLTAGIRSVGDWFKANPIAAQWLLRLVVVFSVLTTAVGALLIPLGFLLAKGLLVRLMLAKLAGVAAGGGAFGSMAAGAGRLVPLLARGALLLLRFMGPIGLLISAGWALYSNWEAVWGGGKALLGDFYDWVVGLLSSLGNWMVGMWNTASSMVSTALSAFVSGVRNLLDGGVGAWVAALLNFSPFGLLWNAFTTALAALGIQVPEQFRSFGGFIIDGLIGGITGRLAALKDAVVGAASSAATWFKEKLGIASPSKLFTQFGGWISEGAANGITAGQAGVRAAALAMAGAAAAPVGAVGIDGGTAPIGAGPSIAPRISAPAPASGGNYTFQIYAAPGMDAQAIARAVRAEIENIDRQKASRGRSAMHDLS